MNKRSKKINITCFTPHWKYPNLNVTWNDIWISYFKGRKKIKESLTFIWAGDIDNQIKQIEQDNAHMRKKTLEWSKNQRIITVKSKDGQKEYQTLEKALGIEKLSLEDNLNLWKDENTGWLDLQWMKEYFKDYNQNFGIMMCSNNTQGNFEPMDGYFYIMVNRPTLNKKDFEDGLEWYLKTIQNIGNVSLNFNWKRTKIWILPA